ncbi:hypothetical protein M5689_024144 [Euphorbia peplus]|nr:hypothetical protein M5689_024144 [Euphorbia peplus]
MLSSNPVRRSERVKHFESNQATRLKGSDPSTTEQEKNKLAGQKHKRSRKEINRQNTSLIGKPTKMACALSSFEPKSDAHVYRRKSIHTRGANSEKKGECSQIVRAGEVNRPIWSGSISVSHEIFGVVDGLEAYVSSTGSREVLEVVKLLPVLLDAQVLPKLDIWPASFQERPPTEDIIDLYIVPVNERSEAAFNSFLDAITREDVVLKAAYADVAVLIFSSLQLTYPNWKTNSGKYYLWAALDGSFPHCQENNSSKLNNGFDIPILHLSNELQPVTEQNEDCMENPSTVQNVPAAYSESIATSVLKMARLFDDQTYPEEEEISSAFAVEEKYVQTLQALLEKHGDITKHCGIKCTKMLICALEGVCETVQDLQNMCFADLRKSHLKSMLSAISDAEMIKLDVKWLRKRYEEFVEAVEELKEYEALIDRKKQVDERVAVQELMESCKEDEIVKLEGEIEKLEIEVKQARQEKERLSSEVTQTTHEKEKLSSEIRNANRKCNYFTQNSLVEGLI